MPERVVDFVACGFNARVGKPVQRIAGVYFRFAEITPRAGDSLFEQVGIRLPEPLAGAFIEDIDKPGIAEEKVELFRAAVCIRCQRAGLDGTCLLYTSDAADED